MSQLFHRFPLIIFLFGCFFALIPNSSFSQGFLKADGKWIVNERGEKVLLRSMGLGGWMLQEGYMLRFQGEGQQYRIRERFESVTGKKATDEFYDAWLRNAVRKGDIDSLRSWGFNSVRLPMHFNLYTLPIEQEPVKGKDTWLETGFTLTDSLLAWCKANKIYLILDLHAAPGGQGNDYNISDRNPNTPSLWDSEENQRKMIALWRKLAERYKDEPWIGAYDIINEPNWGFTDPADKNGLQEKGNTPLRKLLVETTKAIREVDQKHIIIIEGNGWGNNYNGIFPLWDNNLVVSFHKYWNYNNQASIQQFLNIREEQNVPIWLGETGENSNVWFTEMVSLMEANGIGWAMWPLKKLGFNNPLQIKEPAGYQQLLDFFSGKGKKPSAEDGHRTLMQLARNSAVENCIYHPDVVDALFRQIRSEEAIPFKPHVAKRNFTIQAADYDLGRVGVAYYDLDTANYYISTGGERTAWNKGRTYRNDGVDIEKMVGADSFYVTHTETGEWLQYTLTAPRAGQYRIQVLVASAQANSALQVELNGAPISKTVSVPQTGGPEKWVTVPVGTAPFKKGKNVLRLAIRSGGFAIRELQFRQR